MKVVGGYNREWFFMGGKSEKNAIDSLQFLYTLMTQVDDIKLLGRKVETEKKKYVFQYNKFYEMQLNLCLLFMYY